MEIFRRKKESQPSFGHIRLCNTALDFAKPFGKGLDCTRESIVAVEEILEYYSNDLKEAKPTINQVWSMAFIWGTYVGGTLLKNGLQGYSWYVSPEDNIPLLKREDSYEISPITKVYKRLLNGKEDNVVSFYDFAFIIAKGN